MSDKLKKAIDRMVEQSIREILPRVMNEVLLRTIASSGVIQESRPTGPAHQPEVAPRSRKPQPPAPRRKPVSNLRDLLDESAGAEMYSMGTSDDHDVQLREEEPPPPADRRSLVAQLPPELQAMAEDIDIDDDVLTEQAIEGGADPMDFHPANSIDNAGRRLGLDFRRMSQAVKLTEKKVPPKDRSHAQFEEQRLKRMREKLNDGKPVE